MTQEQYNRAVEINERLKEMKEARRNIARLLIDELYSKKSIYSILEKHVEKMCTEIDAEIEKLKKEIEEL